MFAFRERLLSGELLVGSVITLPDVCLAELTAAPADFVWIDLEHGALDTADVRRLAVAARAGAAAALARVEHADSARVGAVLDAGVDGVVAPGIETAHDAAGLVARLHYPPRGVRGFALRRSVPEPACLVQIESAAAAARAVEIAEVEGVDALVVGCADLSLSLGEDPAVVTPALADAVAAVQEAAQQAGLPSGIAGPADPNVIAELAGDRSTCMIGAADVRLYAQALEGDLAGLRRSASRVRH